MEEFFYWLTDIQEGEPLPYEINYVYFCVHKENGGAYFAYYGSEFFQDIALNFEYFPTKTYGDTTLEADFYDAIIVELGNADGNNWWCVVYPPLCFLNAEETSTEGFRYKSLIKELIDKFFN